jgi:sugar lactone lactonase YvrE
LNDVIADKKGNIYISDMFDDVIYIWKDGKISVWLKNPALKGPNGLYTDGSEHILAVFWGNPIDKQTFQTTQPGFLTSLSLKEKISTVTEEPSVKGNLDGITVDNNGNIWISDWMTGDVYKVQKNGSAEKKYNFGQGTADIHFAKELNVLLIPQMGQNKIIAIKI